MTTIREEAMSRISGHADMAGEQQRITALLKDLNATDWVARVASAHDDFLYLLETSHDLAEIRAAYDARAAAQLGGDARNEILDRLKRLQQQRSAQTKAIDPESTAPAFEFLHERLGELMTTVRELDRTLGDVTSIEQALRGDEDSIRAWRDIEDAADTYQAIRSAQNAVFTLVNEEYRPATTSLHTVGQLANAFDLESFWVAVRKSRREEPARSTRAYLEWLESPKPAPWIRLESETWPGGERIGYLRWLATKGHPWVPTLDQLRQAVNDIAAMGRKLSTLNEIRGALDAYERYYTRRGIKSVQKLDVAAIRAELPRPAGYRDNRGPDGVMRSDPRIKAIIGE